MGWSIGEAIEAVRQGEFVCRRGWDGMYLFIVDIEGQGFVVSDAHGNVYDKLTSQRYVAMKTVDDTVVPWLCSQTDLLATDWELA